MNKSTTTIASVPLTWAEDDALQSVARVLKMPKAGVLRLGLLSILKEYAPSEAAKMLRARICRPDKHVACSALAILFIAFVEIQSWCSGEEADFRRARVTRTARVQRAKEGEPLFV